MNILNVGYDSTNYYLLESSTANLLIDVGWPGTLPKFLNVLKRKGVNLRGIKYLLVTYYHPDHAGLVQELKNQGAQLIVLENQIGFIPELKKYVKPEQHYVEIELNDIINITTQESRDFLLRLGIKGEIIYTPGHSDDSVTLILDEGIGFTGDLPGPMQTAEDSSDPVELSWKIIRTYNIRTIYPGHGPVRQLE